MWLLSVTQKFCPPVSSLTYTAQNHVMQCGLHADKRPCFSLAMSYVESPVFPLFPAGILRRALHFRPHCWLSSVAMPSSSLAQTNALPPWTLTRCWQTPLWQKKNAFKQRISRMKTHFAWGSIGSDGVSSWLSLKLFQKSWKSSDVIVAPFGGLVKWFVRPRGWKWSGRCKSTCRVLCCSPLQLLSSLLPWPRGVDADTRAFFVSAWCSAQLDTHRYAYFVLSYSWYFLLQNVK